MYVLQCYTYLAFNSQTPTHAVVQSTQARRSLKAPLPPPPKHTILYNEYLEELPCADMLLGKPARTSVTIQYDVSHFYGPVIASVPLFDFYAPVFYDVTSDEVCHFGPTIRVNRGGTMTHKLINNMISGVTNGPGTADTALIGQQTRALTNGSNFLGTLETNLHTHGIHGSPGLMAQPEGTNNVLYTGGDNIFYKIGPHNVNVPAKSVTYTNTLAPDHMPGMGFVHGHLHGSNAVNMATATMIFIVEDDPAFLPDSTGCGTIRTLLSTVKDRVLHFSVTNFQLPDAINTPDNQAKTIQQLIHDATLDETILDAFLDDANLQYLEEAVDTPWTTCCNTSDAAAYPFKITANQDSIIVNGAYQPRIVVPQNGWQRWRMLNAAIQPMLGLTIVTNLVTFDLAPCQIALIAKDGVYMPQIPRTVTAMYMGSANRAEVLVKCSGSVGQEYYLVSGATGIAANPQGTLPECTPDDPGCDFFHGLAATIEVGPPDSSQVALVDESCTPLRSSYAADMRTYPSNKVAQQMMSMTDLPAFGCNINDQWFKFPTENPFVVTVGTVVDLMVQFANHHAFHIHVQPFQLVQLDNTMLAPGVSFTNYFKQGDFHDTLMFNGFSDALVPLRINVAGARYPGYAVAHCHILPHEDEGCMVVVKYACPGSLYNNKQPPSCPGVTTPINGTFLLGPGGIVLPPPTTPPPAKAPAPSIHVTIPAQAPAPSGSVGVPPAGTPPTPAPKVGPNRSPPPPPKHH